MEAILKAVEAVEKARNGMKTVCYITSKLEWNLKQYYNNPNILPDNNIILLDLSNIAQHAESAFRLLQSVNLPEIFRLLRDETIRQSAESRQYEVPPIAQQIDKHQTALEYAEQKTKFQQATICQLSEVQIRYRLEQLRKEMSDAEKALAAIQNKQIGEEATPNLTQTRQSVETWAQEDRGARKTALNILSEIQKTMAETLKSIRQLGPQFINLSERINGGFLSNGLRRLIYCYRTLQQNHSQEASYYCDELKCILIKEFDCEQIIPAEGDIIDPLTMVLQDASVNGSKVAKIVHCGWRIGEHILVKAIIVPMEE